VTASRRTDHLDYLAARDEAIAGRLGAGGLDTGAALTAALDRDLVALAGPVPAGVAVVALGGYGRGEQCIFSDVDVMVLHRGGEPAAFVRQVLYPLWDMGLSVGHAVRTVAGSRQAAADDLATLTSLLSARLVTGDAELFDELVAVLTDLIRTRPFSPVLAREERARRLRDPYPTMAADLKEGRGGLRTHQGLWWERRRAALLGRPVDQPSAAEQEAKETLLQVRNALHAVSGKAVDRFLVDLREPASRWLDMEVYDLAAMVTAALDEGDRLADRRWPDVHVEDDPLVGLGRRLFATVRRRFVRRPAEEAPADRALALALHAAGRRSGAWLAPSEEEEIRRAEATLWGDADREAFVTLLTAGPRGRSIFLHLEDLGWVERELPEWGPVATAPQLAPFHDHPVGAHLWRTVTEMRALVEGSGRPREVADELGSTEELYLAAFFHDIGKARGGDHSEVGAKLAEGFLRRHGWGPATVGTVTGVIRHHLLLSETATRRDLADPAVIDEVAGTVGDLRTLDVLYLVTIADLRATGTTAWSTWRASLLDRLYAAAREAVATGGARPATPDLESVLAEAPSLDRTALEEHAAAMPPDYLTTTPPAEVVEHLEAADRLEGPALIAPDPTDRTRVLIVGRDRAGFLLAVCRAFAANGVGVLDARLRTREDGTALDTFHVVDDRSSEPVEPSRWVAIHADLVGSLEGGRDLRPRIEERVLAYRRPSPSRPVRVQVRFTGRFTLVEVRAPDRVGLLVDIVEALHAEGLDIHLARIDTMGGEARDVFSTRRVGGIPILAEAELAALRRRLEDRLGA